MRIAAASTHFRHLAQRLGSKRLASTAMKAQVANYDRAEAVLAYWIGPEYISSPPNTPSFPSDKMKSFWFAGGRIDNEVKEKFQNDVEQVGQGLYDEWQEDPQACVAGIILMDQLTRNIYRGTPQAFSLDAKALSWSKHLVDSGKFSTLCHAVRMFALYPFMHAEDLADQELGVKLWAADAAEATAAGFTDVARVLNNCLGYAERHRDVIAKWGRFPHRNDVLGREPTPEEVAGLADGSIVSFA